nr:hypothetical protein [Tanacetum cinerariifolium]
MHPLDDGAVFGVVGVVLVGGGVAVDRSGVRRIRLVVGSLEFGRKRWPEVETGVKGLVEVRVDRVTHPVIADDIPKPAQEEGAVEVTYDTLGDLVQRFHDHTIEIPVHRVQAIEGLRLVPGGIWTTVLRLFLEIMPNTRSRATMVREAVNEQIDRRLVGALRARYAARNLEPFMGNGGNKNGGNGNGGNGNVNGNGGGNGYNFRGFMPARECTYQDFLKCQPLI